MNLLIETEVYSTDTSEARLMKEKETFKDRYCRWRGCAAENFADDCFKLTTSRITRFFAPLLKSRDANFFKEDFDLLREVAEVHSRDELVGELNRFFGRNQRAPWGLRKCFNLRICGWRVLRVEAQMRDAEG